MSTTLQQQTHENPGPFLKFVLLQWTLSLHKAFARTTIRPALRCAHRGITGTTLPTSSAGRCRPDARWRPAACRATGERTSKGRGQCETRRRLSPCRGARGGSSLGNCTGSSRRRGPSGGRRRQGDGRFSFWLRSASVSGQRVEQGTEGCRLQASYVLPLSLTSQAR